jgi:hypothetical protein
MFFGAEEITPWREVLFDWIYPVATRNGLKFKHLPAMWRNTIVYCTVKDVKLCIVQCQT